MNTLATNPLSPPWWRDRAWRVGPRPAWARRACPPYLSRRTIASVGLMLALLLALGCAGGGGVRGGMEGGGNTVALVQAADQAYEQGQWLGAEQGYQRVLERVPNDAYAWFRLGNVRLRQGQYEAAITAYKAVLERERAHSKAAFNLATAYLLRAEQALNQAQKSVGDDDGARRLVGRRLEQLGPLIYSPVIDERSPVGDLIGGAPLSGTMDTPASRDAGGAAGRRHLHHRVRRGESLSRVFERLGLEQAQLVAILASGEEAVQLKRIEVGAELVVLVDERGRVEQLDYREAQGRAIRVWAGPQGYRVEGREAPASLVRQEQ